MAEFPDPAGGVLHIVATPIGNYGDISSRAVSTLRSADIIAAEDTRHSSGLFAALQIQPRELVSLHEHNESDRVAALVKALRGGRSVALVSDAGTPLVNDPGYRLVAAAHDAGIRVSPVPGPSAVVAALSVAGLPSDRFFFEGFLPATGAARRARLHSLRDQRGTLIFLEAPHRVVESLEDLVATLSGERAATLARELSKRFETVRRDTLSKLLEFVRDDADQQRGEIVLLVAGAPDSRPAASFDEDTVLAALAAELPAAAAARVAAKLLDRPRRDLYRRLLELGAGNSAGG